MNDINLLGNVERGTGLPDNVITLENVQKKINLTDKTKPIFINIHSDGGNIYEGLAIYSYLKSLDLDINTTSLSTVASAATVFFLAGKQSTRAIGRFASPLIHGVSGRAIGNAGDVQKRLKEMNRLNGIIADIYALETDFTKEEALELMSKDEMLDVDLLKKKGFIAEVVDFEMSAIFKELDNKDNMNEQLTKKELDDKLDGFWAKFKDLFNSKEQAIDNKVVQDATGVEIDFVNLSKDDAIIEGSEAKIDGKKATGDYTLPNGDVYKFENGKLDSIVTAEVVEMENLKNDLQTNKDLVATLEAEKVELTNELETKNTALESIKTEFTELKNTVTSNFDVDTKVEKPNKEEGTESRKLFK